jgi:beta-lactamase class A
MRALLLSLLLLFTPPAFAGPERLRRDLDAIARRFHGKLGYSLHHLKTGDRLAGRGDEPFPTASTIKLAILCAVMEKQQKGEIAYDETRTFTRADHQDGTGLLQHYREGTRVGLRELLHLMITQSDNSATEMLGQWLGAACVNGWLDRHGLKNTRLLIPWHRRAGHEGPAPAVGAGPAVGHGRHDAERDAPANGNGRLRAGRYSGRLRRDAAHSQSPVLR